MVSKGLADFSYSFPIALGLLKLVRVCSCSVHTQDAYEQGPCTLSCKTKFGSSQGRSEGQEPVGKVLGRELSQAGWWGECLWNAGIFSAHFYPSTHQASLWGMDVINLPEHAKWISPSWCVLVTILLSVGTNLLCATSEIILKASFVWQICLKLSLWFLFFLILDFNNMRKEESPEYQSLKICCWGCRPFPGFLEERSCADEDSWDLAYTRCVAYYCDEAGRLKGSLDKS